MELKEKLEELLKKNLSEPKFRFETAPSGSVGGLITSGSFANRSQTDRQAMVWHYVKQDLSEEEQANIVYLLTLTPAEEADALEDVS